MERDQPKKKKKYVMTGTSSVKNSSCASFQKQKTQQSSLEDKGLERCRFDYSFQEIINHLLARLLPKPEFTIKLSQKFIFGEEKALLDFIDQLDDNIKYTIGLLLEMEEDISKEDIDYKMAEHYRGKTFNLRLIQKSVKGFFEGSKYERDYIAFLEQFKQPEKNRLYVRINKSYLSQFLEAVKNEATVAGQQQLQEQRGRRGNRTVFKVALTTIELCEEEVNIHDMNKFFYRSEKVDTKDLQVQKIKKRKEEPMTYKISLMGYDSESETNSLKLQGFNYYFRHESFVHLPLGDSKNKQAVIQEFANINQANIQTKLLKGYKSSKWEQKNLLYKIRTEQIGTKRSNYTSQYFQGILLRGVLPTVREYVDALGQRVNEVPLDDVSKQIFVDFHENIKDYIRDSEAVQAFVKDFVLKYMKRHQQVCQIQSVKFPLRGVKINILINQDLLSEFELIKKDIETKMPRYLLEQKRQVGFPIDRQFLDRLNEEKILVVDHQGQEFFYLSSNEDLSDNALKIEKIVKDFQKVEEQYIEVVGLIKKNNYFELVQNLKKTKGQYSRLLTPEPSSDDKMHYKLIFYGPRKLNAKFKEEVKQLIDNIESQLGEYSQFINQTIGKLIVEDLNIQQKVQNEYKTSLIVQKYTLGARLEVKLKEKSQIFIIKTDSLNRIPLGCHFYLDSYTSILKLKDTFLQPLKVRVQHTKQLKHFQFKEKTRNYNFSFNDEFSIKEILALSVKQREVGLSSQLSIAWIGLLMPNENKTEWVKSLLKEITQKIEFEKIPFRIFIIETDQSQNLEQVVNIPEYSHIPISCDRTQVKWFCDKFPYSDSVNTKINDALASQQTSVILSNEDMPTVTPQAHMIDLDKMTITYQGKLKTKKRVNEVPFKMQKDQITFEVDGHKLKLPQTQCNTVMYHQKMGLQSRFYVHLLFYLIDLVNKKQINLFTRYQRDIHNEQIKVTPKANEFQGLIKAHYNQKKTQLTYNFKYNDSQHLPKAVETMKTYIDSHWVKQTIKLKEIFNNDFKKILKDRIQTRAQQYGLKFDLDPLLRNITVETFELRDIQSFKKVIENQVQYLIGLSQRAVVQKTPQIKYPPEWQPQTKQVQSFNVPQGTVQFARIQAMFTVRPIYSLTRIQNKTYYKRYCDEREHLTYLNGGKVPKQMELFHGTGDTKSQLVWSDQEIGFNINYSGQHNLLGRGVYFAQKSQYSYSYKSIEGIHNGVQHIHGMLLCSVIVGQSQYMPMNQSNKHVIDTEFKANGIRYESMMGKHTKSDIYVVYKNRRAYPMYLIQFL